MCWPNGQSIFAFSIRNERKKTNVAIEPIRRKQRITEEEKKQLFRRSDMLDGGKHCAQRVLFCKHYHLNVSLNCSKFALVRSQFSFESFQVNHTCPYTHCATSFLLRIVTFLSNFVLCPDFLWSQHCWLSFREWRVICHLSDFKMNRRR